MASPGGSTIYIGGCTAKVEVGSTRVLDPCNCSSYYELVTVPVPNKERKLCATSELWNNEISQCAASQTVLEKGLCIRQSPWDRCEGLTETSASSIRNKCIQKGHYFPQEGNKFSDEVPFEYLIPESVQIANVQLALMSMVAGSIITLVVVAMVFTFCKGQKSGGFGGGLYVALLSCMKCCKCGKVGGRKPKPPSSAAEQLDTVSPNYEDVEDNNEEMLNTGYNPLSSDRHTPSASRGARQPPPAPPQLPFIPTSPTAPGYQNPTTQSKPPKLPTAPAKPQQSIGGPSAQGNHPRMPMKRPLPQAPVKNAGAPRKPVLPKK